ncbi:MAG: HIT family protein, partial [Candidatus Thioglobus sp.]|nr:HIT family protein [Candidatus Thioglobus sp.]
PKRHFATYFEATEDEMLAIGKAVQNAKQILDEEFSPDGYNIGINNGLTAGQSVMHLHVHLIPRYKGDVEDPKGGVRWILKDKANYWDDMSK